MQRMPDRTPGLICLQVFTALAIERPAPRVGLEQCDPCLLVSAAVAAARGGATRTTICPKDMQALSAIFKHRLHFGKLGPFALLGGNLAVLRIAYALKQRLPNVTRQIPVDFPAELMRVHLKAIGGMAGQAKQADRTPALEATLRFLKLPSLTH